MKTEGELGQLQKERVKGQDNLTRRTYLGDSLPYGNLLDASTDSIRQDRAGADESWRAFKKTGWEENTHRRKRKVR